MAGLYLHTPFCLRKCSYCDFFSAPPEDAQLENWHSLLQANLRLLETPPDQPLETIFFGGGTPSLLSAMQIDAVLRTCREQFILADELEISLEANPADLTPEKIDGYLAAGINRLSLGIQSFRNTQLHQLGRRHTADMARNAFSLAREAGFDNLSVDLIFALPDQDLNALDREIEQLLALEPNHVGIYGLSIEPQTILADQVATGILYPASEEDYATAYLHLSEQLVRAGFEHYEISNFARPGYRCRHNQGYWRRTTCLAAGCGAHGFAAEGYGSRTEIPPDLERYRSFLERGENPAIELERFKLNEAMAETLYLGLRTRDGVEDVAFVRAFGQNLAEAYPSARDKLSPYLKTDDGRWSFTPEGWLLYDHLISHFLHA